MTKKLKIEFGTTVGELKRILSDVPNDVAIDIWDSGEALVEDITLEVERWEFQDKPNVSLNVVAKNTVY